MKENGGKWITGLKYGTVGGSSGTAAEAAEKDESDNVLTWQFTTDYTEELIGLWLTKTGASYESTAALFLDFAQAKEMEEPEPGEDWVNLTDGTYEIPLDIYYGTGSGQSTINRPFFEDQAKVEVSEGKMTVSLGMKENGGKWVTGLNMGP